MAQILLEAINKVTEKNITLYELCTNYDGATANKREYNTKKKQNPGNMTVENSVILTCNRLTHSICNLYIDVRNIGYDISDTRCILQSEDYYYIRRDDLSNLNILDISIMTIIHRLIDYGVCNNFKEGTRIVTTRKLNGYGGIRFIEINKDKLFSTATNNESKMLYQAYLSEKYNIKETKEKIERDDKHARQKHQKTSNTNNNNRYRSNSINNNSNNKCIEVFSKIDHLSNYELDKVIEYIDTIKKLRELRNSVK
jgi:hypothetical protein